MIKRTSAQLANAQRVEARHNIQGCDDSESLFHLSSAPPLQKHIKAAEIFLEVRHFVPTRFEDKIKYMMAIERNRKAFLEERKRAKELLALGLASHELRASILGKPSPSAETSDEITARKEKEAAEAREENRLFALYELHEDRKRYNKEYETSYNQNKLHKAHHFAKMFIGKCSELQMETALRQNVVSLRAMGHKLAGKGRRCLMEVDEARNGSDSVIEPKLIPSEARWLTSEVSPLSPHTKKTKSGLGRDKRKRRTYNKDRTIPRRKTRRARKTLRQNRERLALTRRVVLQSCRKLPAL